MTHPVAEEIQGSIAWIVPWAKSIRSAVDDRLFPPRIQQGPDDGKLGIEHLDHCTVAHPLQPGETRPADEMHQHGLHLVICGMPHRDSLGIETVCLLQQEAVTGDTCSFFKG